MDDWRRTHDWGALTREEIARARDGGALAVLTVGSIEQHADHLPVDTDTLSAYRVAMLAAEQCATPHVLVLPPPPFGFSPQPPDLAWHDHAVAVDVPRGDQRRGRQRASRRV